MLINQLNIPVGQSQVCVDCAFFISIPNTFWLDNVLICLVKSIDNPLLFEFWLVLSMPFLAGCMRKEQIKHK